VAGIFGDSVRRSSAPGVVFEVLDLPIEVRDHPGAIAMPSVRGQLDLRRRDVPLRSGRSAGAHTSTARLQGEDRRAGGPSGAGKTTIVNLVPRFNQPQEGSGRLDGAGIADVGSPTLRRAIAILPQDVQLFRGSILENIRYDVSRQAMKKFTPRTRCKRRKFVPPFLTVYATEVGERGMRLSGGERPADCHCAAMVRNRGSYPRRGYELPRYAFEALIEEALDRLLPGARR